MSESFDPYYHWLGIPPEEQPANHYQLLGIKWFEDNIDVISAAVDRQMLHLRTYQIGEYSDLSQRLMNEVVSAKLCLLDPKRKAVYDQKLLEGDLAASIEAEKAAGSTAFGPHLEALFGEAEQAEPSEMLYKPRPKRWKLPKHCVKLFATLCGVVIMVLVLIAMVNWLAGNLRGLFNGDQQQVAVPVVPEAPDDNKRPIKPKNHLKPQQTVEPESPNGLKPKPPDVAPRPIDTVKAPSGESDKKKPSQAPGAGVQPPKQPTQSSGDNKGAPAKVNGRFVVPSEDARQKAILQLNKTYGVSQDLGPLDKARLAKRLLKGAEIGIAVRDPAVRYEMLETASALAAESGDLNLAIKTIDKIGELYDIDPLAAKVSCLVSAASSAKEPLRIGQVVTFAGTLVDEAVEKKKYDTALRIIEVSLRVCDHPGGKPLRKAVIVRRKEIQKLREQYGIIHTAKTKLQNAPDDGEANLVLGSYLCFDDDDWDSGLPHLAKGNDEGLARLAKRELENPPKNIDEEIELADAWWTLASKTFGPRKKPVLLRSAHWYKRVQPKLTIGPKTKHVDKRMETIIRLTEAKAD